MIDPSRIRLEKSVGEGEYGKVYKAVEIVAVKTLKDSCAMLFIRVRFFCSVERRRELFLNEA